ncbi:hypothetical protein H8959_022712 [Pygathrix nigripes]
MYTLTHGEQRHVTHENAQGKQARTGEEQEEEEEQISDSESEDEKNEITYNPKNLPLGWDGKPVPYWLYKFHGLNINYNCEICGNYTYQGPKPSSNTLLNSIMLMVTFYVQGTIP